MPSIAHSKELYFDVDYAGNKDFVTISAFGNLNARLISKNYNSITNITVFRLAINFLDVQDMHSITIVYEPNGGGTDQTETFNFPKVKKGLI